MSETDIQEIKEMKDSHKDTPDAKGHPEAHTMAIEILALVRKNPDMAKSIYQYRRAKAAETFFSFCGTTMSIGYELGKKDRYWIAIFPNATPNQFKSVKFSNAMNNKPLSFSLFVDDDFPIIKEHVIALYATLRAINNGVWNKMLTITGRHNIIAAIESKAREHDAGLVADEIINNLDHS
jgi:hypothetical protein